VRAHWPLLVLVASVGILYARSLLPGMHDFGDITKAQFLGRFLGMTHPTGYPLYILTTAPIAHLPIGSLAWRINAFSAVCGLGAVVLCYGIMRQQGVRPTLAAVGAAAFAFSKTAWEQFSIAEVYGLGALLVAAVLLLLVRWLHTGKLAWFIAAAGVYSLSFGNHLTVITLLPAFALATVLSNYRALLRPKVVLAVLGLIALGASQYAYLFWASQSDSLYLEYRVRDVDEFLEFVTGERYRRVMFAFEWPELLSVRLPRFTAQLVRDLGPLALLSPLGLLATGHPNREDGTPGKPGSSRATARSNAVLALAGVGQLLWVMNYEIPDIEVYLIPLTLITAVFAAQALELWASRMPMAAGHLIPAGVSLGLVVLLATSHAPTFSKPKRFVKKLERSIQVMDRDAALVSRIHYSPRMGYVYRFYAERLSESRNLHLIYRASPKAVSRYLRGERPLRDSHTGQQLPPGMRLYVDSRGAKEKWGGALRLRRAGAGLSELTLADHAEPASTASP
jgi:hypothetical protein